MKSLLRLVLFSIFMSTTMASLSFADNIYRCQSETGIIFQDVPCPGNADEKILDSGRYPPTLPTIPNVSASEGATTGGSGKGAKPAMKKIGGQGQIIIERSSDTHFYIEGLINGNSVHFLVDTGASLVAIPDNLMAELGLKDESAVNVRSAAGNLKAFKTTIKKLTLGEYVFDNVEAQTMSGTQPLLGMNILSEFDVTLKDNQMILSNKND